MKSIKIKENNIINILPNDVDDVASLISDICVLAQNNEDFYWECKNAGEVEDVFGPGFTLEYRMGNISHIAACYMAQFLNKGVETDVILKDLCSSPKTYEEWVVIIKDCINLYS